MSWQFQLLGPGAKSGDDLVVVQEVKGSAPVFHQIYWNGRRQYFGPPLPAGRYECVLSATDMRNRTHKEHEWVTLLGPAPQAVEPEAPVAKAQAAAPPPSELPGAEPAAKKAAKATRPWAKGKVKGKNVTARKGKGKGKGKAKVASKTIGAEPSTEAAEPGKEGEQPAAGASEGAKPQEGGTGAVEQPAASGAAAGKESKEEDKGSGSRSGVVNYQPTFIRNTANITPDGESILGRVADTMRYYPLDNIKVIGYAYSGETGAEKLAQQRAELVEKVLVDQHGLKRDRIKTSSKVGGREVFKVDIYILPGEK
jgi:outer membrane protein OmpA-like peptidoglycan-associated protein